jgi:ankyrin repeat protein
MIANQHIELEDAGHRVVPAFADGLTRLICACSWGSIEVVRLLIANKVDLEARDVGAMTSLIYAVLNGHILIVRFLKEQPQYFCSLK